ncbi:hypothetical protein, partial [Brachyspira pilosicoli]|uniref:hypothetical protein n=1 Tax=Brachyspira pilosicoli TaxID=52584 RepID=UPI003003C484
SIITLALLGKKERVGYLSDLNLNIDTTLEINELDIYETKQLFTKNNNLDKIAIVNYLLTNESISNYSYGFKIKYYDKVFRNSDIYGVYPNIDNILSNNTFIREIKISENGSPFGNLVSTKFIDFDKIDNINYILKLKYNFILLGIILLIILSICVCFVYKADIYNFTIKLDVILKRNKILVSIICAIVAVIIISIIILAFLGKKERVGYLSDFNLNIDKTLKINGFNINETRQLFTIEDKLDEMSITNYIFTNVSITNYSYDFRLKCYSKVFRDSAVYDVYPTLNNVPEYIKLAKITNSSGEIFDDLISSKIINVEKIDNINYILKLKYNFILLGIILLIILSIYICYIFRFNIYELIIRYKNIIFYRQEEKDNKSNLYIYVIIIFLPIIFLFYQYIVSSYSYFFANDSSLTYIRDIIAVHNNIIPDHILHPNMIPLVIYEYIIIPFGTFFNIIPDIHLSNLKNTFNPYMNYAEVTEYVLLISKIISVIFMVILYLLILNFLKLSNFIKNKFILFITLLSIFIFLSINKFLFDGYVYYGTVIRYETTGILLSSLSLCFIILTSNYDIDSFKHRFYIIISGFLIGGGILSKILVGAWAIPIAIIYLILNIDKYYNYKSNKDIKLRGISIFLVIFTIVLILFNILVYYRFTNQLVAKVSFIDLIDTKKLIYFQMFMPLFFILISIYIILLNYNIIKLYYSIKVLSYNFVLFVVSCILAILFALLLPKGLDVLIITYLNSYAGGSILVTQSLSSHVGASTNAIKYLLFIFAFLLIMLFTLVKNKNKIIKNVFITKILLSIILVFISFIFTKILRNTNYDTPISYSIFYISLSVLIGNLFITKYRTILFLPLLIFIIFTSFTGILNLKDYIDYKYNFIGYNGIGSANNYYLKGWRLLDYYNGELVTPYSSDEEWRYMFDWSRDTKSIKRLLKNVRISNNELEDSIIAVEGSLVSKDKNYYISKIDYNLNGGLLLPLIDNNNIVYVREDYSFYFITDKKDIKENEKIKYVDYDFYINDKKYFVYKLDGIIISIYNEDMKFNFKKNRDFNTGFILINSKSPKGL